MIPASVDTNACSHQCTTEGRLSCISLRSRAGVPLRQLGEGRDTDWDRRLAIAGDPPGVPRGRELHMASITERETQQVEQANASGNTPVVFIHGLWLLPSSWNRWA